MSSNLEQMIEQYLQALEEIMKGSADGYRRIYSRQDDCSLANPFGPSVRGWKAVDQALEGTASHYRDGGATECERIVTNQTREFAYTVEMERVRARVDRREDVTPISVPVTTIFRLEDGVWKVVHRHADPITSPRSGESVIQTSVKVIPREYSHTIVEPITFPVVVY